MGRVAATTGLSLGEAARVVADVVAFYAESTNDYVRRRHSELQGDGMKNPEIFARLQTELVGRVVAPPPCRSGSCVASCTAERSKTCAESSDTSGVRTPPRSFSRD